MRITCARRSRDEILRERDEYDTRRKSIHDEYDSQMKNYRKALYDVYDSVRLQLEQELAPFRSLNLDIDVSQAFRGGLEVTIRSNDHNVHDETKALSWSWIGRIGKNGEVERETGSWSGLNAVTQQQLASLRQSVECLEVINSLDWATILSTDTPDPDEYVTVNTYDVDRNRPNFEKELREVTFDDCVGQRKLLVDKNNSMWGIVSATPKFYTVFSLPYTADIVNGFLEENRWSLDELAEKNAKYAYKISKDKFTANFPQDIQVIEY